MKTPDQMTGAARSSRRRRHLRRAVLGLGLTAAAIGGVSAQPASAARGDSGYTSGGNVRACPGTCAIVAWATPGPVKMYCWVDGYYTQGSPRWFLVGRDNQFGGYMHASTLPRQASVPHC